MKKMKRLVSFLMASVMIVGLLPARVYATTDDSSTTSLNAALEEAKTYIDALTINNSSNDPEKVVTNKGTHFTWDNEKRENSKSYLYEWSYYNGVVFEGLDYIYDVTGDTTYSAYVQEYLDAMITDGELNSYAGYVDYHGADCYKTASLLVDYYKVTGDNKYLQVAETLYKDLIEAENSYLLPNAGYNWRHTWATDPSPDLWLDGLYMILPFRAEYASHVGDTDELDQIVSRLAWVSENMEGDNGWFYHAADSASSNSGTYWLRSIGWYAAALADVMDYMTGDNFTAVQSQFKKLVDGMVDDQNDYGMWLNNLAATESSSNPYETSGTALICYAIMKAVNNGWLDSSYAQYAIKAFEGICSEKLTNNNLTDICFKGAPGSSNSTFYDNEGKGVGPFIMLYAEVLEYNNNQTEETPDEDTNTTESEVPDEETNTTESEVPDEETNTTESEVPDEETNITESETPDEETNTTESETPEETPSEGQITVNVKDEEIAITVVGVTSLTSGEASDTAKQLVDEKEYQNYLLFDVTATLSEDVAIISVPVPEDWNITEANCDRLVGLSVEDGVLKEIEGTYADGVFSFEVSHFSDKGVALTAEPTAEDGATDGSVSGTGNLVGGTVYTLDTDGVIANRNYLIVNTGSDGTGYALTNNSGNAGRTEVTISNSTITVDDDTNIAWMFSGSTSGTVGNNDRYVHPARNSLSLNISGSNLTINNQNNGAYIISRSSGRTTYYLRYSNNSWPGSTSSANVYLYEYTSSSTGEAVTFTVTPGATTLAPEAAVTLTGTVTVADETVDLRNCTITWASDNKSYVTVSSGTLTGVADGSANITATLSAVNGTALKENIVLTIPVTVQSKAIASATLTGNTPVTTKINVEPDFSNIKLEVTYDDGTTGTITVDNGLVIEGYDITTIGSVYATISYAGVEYGTVRVTVEGNPYEGLENATIYPEYPDDGAVRIDKTANQNAEVFKNTGVTHVELEVAGVSVKKGVNVLLIADISNSMSWDDSEYNYNDTTITDGSNQRLNASKESAKTFVNELLKANDDGSETLNTVSLLAFAGIDGDYNTHSTAAANDDVYQLGDLAMTDVTAAEAAIDKLVKATTGGTNYDYAFQQAYEMAQDLYELNGQEVHIVFMTDGAPTHYNGVYYKSRSNTDLTACMQYVDPTTGETSSYTSTGYDRSGNDIDVTATQSITVYYNDGTTETKNVTYNKGWSDYVTGNANGWAKKVKALDYVAKVYSIGFGMKNGSVTQGATTSMPTLSGVTGGQYYIPYSTTKTLLESVASTSDDYYEAEDTAGLTALYQTLATKIRYAGTSAQATDIIGSDFTLQMAAVSGSGSNTATLSNFGITPSITITVYDLYTKAETSDTTLIGTRKDTSEVLETVIFNDAGTEAYSNLVEDGATNIMSTASDGTVTIVAHYFTYTKTPEGVESFKWTIGNITDKEIVLGFDVYLKGSLGETGTGVPDGIYYTNEEAVLEYVDINGDHAKQTFPVPAVNWGGASTTIRFYLVNEKGEPVNRDGEVVPLANAIYVGDPVTIKLNLNTDSTIEAQTIEAAAYVPSEYYLYDINAYYEIQTASGDDNTIVGGITVSTPSTDAYKTANGVTQIGAQTTIVLDYEETYYTWSYVGFGVRYDLTKEKTEQPLIGDQVVIDYGKTIVIDVLNDDPTVDGYNRSLSGFVLYNENVDTSVKQLNAGATSYTAENGIFSITDDQKVQFQLTKMLSEVQSVFYVVKYQNATNAEDYYYLFGQLDVIPATTVYYETDFADGVFNMTTTGTEWTTKDDEIEADSPQDDGTVGHTPHTYGYDSSYTNDIYLSDGDSFFVEGQGKNNTVASFSFTGTGFDIISRTGAAQGLVQAIVYSDAAKTNTVKTISVLNKSESNLELYQIPVLSVELDSYGTYYVELHVYAAYTAASDSLASLNRGGEFYFDAVRIFNPAQGNTVAEDAYAEDGEYNPQVEEVRDMLLDAETFNALNTTDSAYGVVFVDCTYTDGEADGTTGSVEIADYATIGPNNEVYLANGQAIAFKITANSVPASIDVGAKTITGGEAILSAVVTDSETTTYLVNETIASSTAQNINLMNDTTTTAMADKTAYVIITNTGEDVLSITDIKIAYDATAAVATASDLYGLAVASETDESTEVYDPYAVSFTVDAQTFAVARSVMTASENMEEEIPEEEAPEEEAPEETAPDEGIEEEPNYDILSATISFEGSRKKQKKVIVVETTQDVVELKITERKKNVKYSSMEYVDQEDGLRVWTIVLSKNSYGNPKYTITGYGEDGTSGASISINNFVSNKDRR